MQKVLMHTCCAPCSVYCIDSLRAEGIEPVVFWYNPNIHPYTEYKARRDCLKEYVKKVGVEAIFKEEYGLDEFCKNVAGDIENRCAIIVISSASPRLLAMLARMATTLLRLRSWFHHIRSTIF